MMKSNEYQITWFWSISKINKGHHFKYFFNAFFWGEETAYFKKWVSTTQTVGV